MERYALVPGADRGLGLALTKRLLADGYQVFAGRYLDELTHLDDLRAQYPEQLQLVRIDIGNDESVAQAGREIAKHTDRLDIVFNTAAILGEIDQSIFESLDFASIQQVINVNSIGPLRVINATIDLLMNGDTKLIVNVSSESGSIGAAATPGHAYKTDWFGYCMSKTAVNMVSALVHNKIKEAGGQVIVVEPGWMKTHMRGHLDEAATFTPEQSADFIMQHVANREKYRADLPVFVNPEGKQMLW